MNGTLVEIETAVIWQVIDEQETTTSGLLAILGNPGNANRFTAATIGEAVAELEAARLLEVDGDLIRPTPAAVLYSEMARLAKA